jgi:hypothetical protein
VRIAPVVEGGGGDISQFFLSDRRRRISYGFRRQIIWQPYRACEVGAHEAHSCDGCPAKIRAG